MHQTARVVAPLNTDPKWPQGYITVLREAGAQEKNIPYCVAWVQQFFSSYPGRSWRNLGRREIEVFLSEAALRAEVFNYYK